jgi:hypothetical protein
MKWSFAGGNYSLGVGDGVKGELRKPLLRIIFNALAVLSVRLRLSAPCLLARSQRYTFFSMAKRAGFVLTVYQ